VFESLGEQSPSQSEAQSSGFESANESLCKLLHSNWYHLTNIPLGGTLVEAPGEVKSKQRSAIINLGDSPNRVVVDPSLCFLLPAWQEFLSSTRFIIYVDEPLVVARALQKRWRFPIAFGVALWEYYMRSALINTKGLSRVIIGSENLYKNPVGTLESIQEFLNLKADREQGVKIPTSAVLSENNNIANTSDIQGKNDVFIDREQREFFKTLLSGDEDILNLDRMSEFGEDNLKAYGRLRAGYDLIKREHEKSLREIVVLREKQKQLNAEIESKTIASDSDANNVLVMTVYIDGMAPLELSCHSSSPVIQQLMDAMVRKSRCELGDNELFYLQLGERALYFPITHLKGVETSEEGLAENLEPAEKSDNVDEDDTSNSRIAIVVLGCFLPVYMRAIETIRNTWASKKHSDIDIFYIYGAHGNGPEEQQVAEELVGAPIEQLSAFEVRQFDDILLCGCADSISLQTDCLLRKRLIAFKYLSEKRNYDYIYTVCASSYVDQSELGRYVTSLNHENVFHGPVGVCQFSDMPYVSGASMLFSADLIRTLTKNMYSIIEQNQSAYADDVAIGRWIATNVSDGSLESIVEQIEAGERATTDDTFVRVRNRAMVNYVDTEILDHQRLPDIYHYHFKTDSVEQMVAFDRHFD